MPARLSDKLHAPAARVGVWRVEEMVSRQSGTLSVRPRRAGPAIGYKLEYKSLKGRNDVPAERDFIGPAAEGRTSNRRSQDDRITGDNAAHLSEAPGTPHSRGAFPVWSQYQRGGTRVPNWTALCSRLLTRSPDGNRLK